MNGLQFFVHNDSGAMRMELAGNLRGADIETVYQAWQRATLRGALKPVIVDITFITDADQDGRALLAVMHRFGTQIIAESPASSAIAQPIMTESIEAEASKPGWFHRLIMLLVEEGPAAAPIPAQAEIFNRVSAGYRRGGIEYAAHGDFAVLEDAVR